MDGVDLFPILAMRRRILQLVEDVDEEAKWEEVKEEVKVKTSEEGKEGCRLEEENEALRRRDACIRWMYHKFLT